METRCGEDSGARSQWGQAKLHFTALEVLSRSAASHNGATTQNEILCQELLRCLVRSLG